MHLLYAQVLKVAGNIRCTYYMRRGVVPSPQAAFFNGKCTAALQAHNISVLLFKAFLLKRVAFC